MSDWYSNPSDGRERLPIQVSISAGTATVRIEGRISSDDPPVLLKEVTESTAFSVLHLPQIRANITASSGATVRISADAALQKNGAGTPLGNGGSVTEEDSGSGGAATLPDITTAGTFGGPTKTLALTRDAKGRVTDISESTIQGTSDYLKSQTDAPQYPAGVPDGSIIFDRVQRRFMKYLSAAGEWVPAGPVAILNFNPRAYGAKCDSNAQTGGGTDDTAAINECILALKAARAGIIWGGGALEFEAGAYRVNGEIVVENLAGCRVFGQGPRATVFVAHGATGTPVMSFRSCLENTIEDFTVIGGPRPTCIEFGTLTTAAGKEIISSQNRLSRLTAFGGDRGFHWNGERIVGGANIYQDANNDLFECYGLLADGYRTAGYHIGHSQAKHHRFFGCRHNGGWEIPVAGDNGTAYTNTFTDPATLAAFTPVTLDTASPTWAISGGNLTATCDTSLRFGFNSVTGNTARSGRITFTLAHDPQALPSDVACGTAFRYQSVNNFYLLLVYKSVVHIFEKVSGALTSIASVAVSSSQGDVFTLDYGAGTAAVTRNGDQILTTILNQNIQGTFGPAAINNLQAATVAFADFTYAPRSERDIAHFGVLITRGSMKWWGGGGGHNGGCDYMVCASFDNCLIVGTESEGSNRQAAFVGDYDPAGLLGHPGGGVTGSPFEVQFTNNRFAVNGLHPDRVAIYQFQPGFCDISDNQFTDGLDSPQVRIHIAPSAGWRSRIVGNGFPSAVGADFTQASELVIFDGQSTYGEMECHSNTLLSGGNPLNYPMLPENNGFVWLKQGGTYFTNNTAETVYEWLGYALPGVTVTLVAKGGNSIVRNIHNLQLHQGLDWKMAAGSTLTLHGVRDTTGALVWHEVGRKDATRPVLTGANDIEQLEIDVGGIGSLLNIWDRRFGITAAGGKVTQWADARGASRGAILAQAADANRFTYDAGTQTVTMTAPGQYMEALNVSSARTERAIVAVYKNRVVGSGERYLVLEFDPDNNTAGYLGAAGGNNIMGGFVLTDGTFLNSDGGSAGALLTDAVAVAAMYTNSYPFVRVQADTAGSLSSGSTTEYNVTVQSPRRVTRVLVGTSDVPTSFDSLELCAVLRVSLADRAAGLAAISAWATANHP